ncbi:MAG: GNAT family N-acetyltransferase [Proteobacteria bacterium]|nr:GNAT family N-acetyltransferase [Pseudomonadota bacterium]
MYHIRQATIQDWPSIRDFINRTYGSSARYKDYPRWHWQFCDTPYQREPDDYMPVWIALQGDRVVGQIALQPSLLRLGMEVIPASWIVDVMVDQAHRGRGLGRRINDAVVASGRLLITLTMAPATRSIMEAADCVTLPPVQQMVRLNQLSGTSVALLLERIADNRARWRHPISLFNRSLMGPALLARALSLVARLQRGAAPSSSLPMREIAALDAATIDRLAGLLTTKVGASFDRSASFHTWRFNGAPDLAYRFAEVDAPARALVTWRLPRPVELPVGTLVDLLADPNDGTALRAGIDHAITAMANCEAIIAGASDLRLVDALRSRGFVTVKTHHPTAVSTDRALLTRIAAEDCWHFTKADHDWDQIHPATH